MRQIVLLDAPAGAGWRKCQLKTALTNAAKSGRMWHEPVDTMAHILLAALLEIALLIARAENPREATRSSRAAIAPTIWMRFSP